MNFFPSFFEGDKWDFETYWAPLARQKWNEMHSSCNLRLSLKIFKGSEGGNRYFLECFSAPPKMHFISLKVEFLVKNCCVWVESISLSRFHISVASGEISLSSMMIFLKRKLRCVWQSHSTQKCVSKLSKYIPNRLFFNPLFGSDTQQIRIFSYMKVLPV